MNTRKPNARIWTSVLVLTTISTRPAGGRPESMGSGGASTSGRVSDQMTQTSSAIRSSDQKG